MTIELVPDSLRQKYRFAEWNHACAILSADFSSEWQNLLDCLDAFVLRRSEILKPGGRRSAIPDQIDGFLQTHGWSEKRFH
ncbi:MAG: BglII/BstYI family type II restriction endonuclease, partial [Planctomycetaceae bacterium]